MQWLYDSMWKIKDWFRNTFYEIRLWFYVSLKPSRFHNINNNIDKNGWKLTFNDEFNGDKLDRTKWDTIPIYGLRYHPGSIVNDDKSPISYADDSYNEFTGNTLKQKVDYNPIEIEHTDWDGNYYGKYIIPYRFGLIDSHRTFSQQYGYFEIRSKITNQPGAWPAFWLTGDITWPPEIDIYEIYTGRKNGGKKFESNFHWGSNENKRNKVGRHKVMDVSDDFHIYAVEWTPSYMKIYYDNLLIRVFSNPNALKHFNQKMHVIINNGLDIEHANDTKYPHYHEVDYVRCYKKN